MNTPLIQRYVHQFINELQVDFEKVTAAVDEFAAVGEFGFSMIEKYLSVVSKVYLQLATSKHDLL